MKLSYHCSARAWSVGCIQRLMAVTFLPAGRAGGTASALGLGGSSAEGAHPEIFFSYIRISGSSSSHLSVFGSVMKYGEM